MFERITKKQSFLKFSIFLLLFSMLSTSIPPQIVVAQDSSIDYVDDEGEHGNTRNEKNGKDYEHASVNKQVSFGDKPGEYFIDLEITGKDNTQIDTTDIVLVYDNSNSMNAVIPGAAAPNNTRVTVAKQATSDFVTELLSIEGNEFRFSLVTYGSSVFDGVMNQTWGGNPGITANHSYKEFTNIATNITSQLPSYVPSDAQHAGNTWHGGTFTQQALVEAGNILSTSNADNKIIVTITDGAPTLSYRSGTSNTNNNIEGDGTSYSSNRGTRTINTAASLMNNYELYTLGIGLSDGDPGAGASPEEIMRVINGISSNPDHAYLADTVGEMVDALHEIASKMNKSVIDGSVEDPMGEYFQLQGADDFTAATNNDLTDGNYYLSGNKDGLTEGVTVNTEGQKITVNGLNLGEDETVTLRYKVQIDTEKDGFESDTFYRTNGETILTPRGINPSERNKFPEPEASAKGITVEGEKIWEDFGLEENRPPNINVNLMNGETVVETVEVSPDENGDWKYEFSDALWYDSNGNVIEYTFDEEPVEGYEMIENDNEKIVNKLIAEPEISLEKSATSTSDLGEDVIEVGENLEYTFTITNTGNLPLENITLIDELEGISEFEFISLNDEDFTGAIEELVLQPNDVLVATATYYVTQEDFDYGQVENEANVVGTPTGHDPNDPDSPQPVEDDDNANVPGELDPKISLEKTASKATVSETGEEITYTFTIKNTGNTTLTDVTLDDPMLGGNITLNETTLQPGEETTVDVIYETTQEDINAGEILNEAAVEGTPPPAYTENPDNPNTVTDEDDEKVTSEQEPAIELVKEGNKDELVEGETIEYTFTATNTGNVTLTNVAITDELVGLSDIEYVSVNAEDITDPENITLEPGDVLVAHATYEVSQTDVDYGQVYNEATVTGIDPKDEEVTDKDDEWVPHDPELSIELEKISDKQVVTEAGEEIEFSFDVTNTSSVTLTDVEVSDPMLEELDIEIVLEKTTLKPGETTTGSANYIVTEADIEAGSIKNIATATGTPPNPDNPKPEDPSEVEVPVAKIELEKSSQPGMFTEENQEIIYTLKVTNNGEVTLNNIVLYDEKLGGEIELEVDSLEPSESTEVEVPYMVTEADVEAGEILNIADVTGEPEGYDPEDENSPQPVTDIDDDRVLYAALLLEKTSDKEEVTEAGEEIEFTFEVTNTGKVTLENVIVNDPMLEELGIEVELAQTTLEPGESTIGTATYIVTQEDINNGGVTNVATTTGTPPGYDPEDPNFPDEPPVSPPSEEEVPADQNPEIKLIKAADIEEFTEVGQEVNYTFTVENTGNVTLTDVRVDDETFGLTILLIKGDNYSTETVTLAPGETATGTFTYTVTQADMDNGEIPNVANTKGTPPPVIDPEDPNNPVDQEPVTDEDEEIVTGQQNPNLSLEKVSDKENVVKAGDEITYTLTVTNTGNVTLDNVTVNDEMLGGDLAVTPSTLAPGETGTVTGTYVVTQEDIDHEEEILNIATATGTPPDPVDPENPTDPPVTPPVEEEVPVIKDPAITLVKQADQETLVEGETITYTFTATNTGNLTLLNVNITDVLEGISEVEYISINDEDIVDFDNITLAPGDVLVANATYEITQADVDNNEVSNHATVQGTPSGYDPEDPDSPQPVEDEDDVKVPADHKPEIELEKSSNKEEVSEAGEVITYKFTITNTGNVTLDNIEVNDPMLEALDIEITYEKNRLVPGESTVGYADYTVTQEDIDSGLIKNIATSTGTPPGYDPENPPTDPTDPTYPPVSPPDEVEVPAKQDPAINIQKTSDVEKVTEVGEEITYTFTVTNTGNVTLKDVKVDDPMIGQEIELTETTLAPGESTVGTAKYVVTQDDLNNGELINVATTEGTPPNYDPEDPTSPEKPTDTDDDKVPVDQNPSIDLVKATDRMDLVVNEEIKYTFTSTNTGNVTLTDVSITDELEGISDITYISINGKEITDSTSITLHPGDILVAKATYTITQDDVDKGKVENYAVVTGKDPMDRKVSDDDHVTVPQEQAPSIELEKSSDVDKVIKVDEEITYSFKVTNTGNVTLHQLSLNDPMLGGQIDLEQTKLVPGESTTVTVTYKTTDVDLTKDEIVNVADITGVTLDDKSVTDEDRDVIPVEKVGSPQTNEGDPLPVTATNVFNLMLIGIGLIVLGFIFIFIRRRTVA